MASYYRYGPHPAVKASHHDYNYDYDYLSAPVPSPRRRRATMLASPSGTSFATINTSSSGSSGRPHYRPSHREPRITLDSLLESHSNPHNSLLQYDVALPPNQARRTSSLHDAHSLSYRDRAKPATSPPLPFLHLTCPQLPWPIDIHPSSGSGYVTVGDVLEGIYQSLRHHVSKSEWVTTRDSTRRVVQDTFYRRVGRSQTHREYEAEYSSGVRRVDWIGRNTSFAGLARDGWDKGPEEWTLLLGLPERKVKFAAGQ